MKAAVVHAVDDVRIVEMEEPEPGPGEIVVAMRAVGLCGSDITPWYVASKAPAVLGHETAGVIAKLGSGGATDLREGDRVFVHHHTSCGLCRRCLRGDDVMCAEWKPVRLHPGGLAERVRVSALSVSRDTLLLPQGMSFAQGSLVEPVACAVKAVRRGNVRPGDTVAVVGLGSNGLLLGALARHAGAAHLVGSDPDPSRRALALTHGFDAVCDPREQPLAEAVCADAVFVIPTVAEAVTQALDAAAPGGSVVFYSPIAKEKVWEIAPHGPYFRDLTLRFSYSSGPAETREALALLAARVVTAESLYTHRLPLERAGEAFRLAARGGDVLKVLVTIGDAETDEA